MGHGPHSSTLVVICVVWLLFVLFFVLFVCKCVLPPGDNPIAVNKYITSYHVSSRCFFNVVPEFWPKHAAWDDIWIHNKCPWATVYCSFTKNIFFPCIQTHRFLRTIMLTSREYGVSSRVLQTNIWLKNNTLTAFKVRQSVHHHTIQINQQTRYNNFSSLLLDVYVQLNMFRASSRPWLGAQQLQ